MFEDGIIVTTGDVLDCGYRFIGPVSVSVTEDFGMGEARGGIFRKFHSEARKMGADAVIMVKAGGTYISPLALDRRRYEGRAVRFVNQGCLATIPCA